ncbi:MAG: hypothetical protein COA94_08990 [Rickettsiales bacterium]|nr:MAG: hypothetical protein COA94_08990 [Rickettsiales bacterium]
MSRIKKLFLYFLGILILTIGYYIFFHKPKADLIRSELPLPCNEIILVRSDLINQIASSLKEKSGIQTVVLHGIGGAGKTTLARQYASSQPYPIIWEVNAENSATLNASFERFIYSSCKSEKLKNEFKLISKDNDAVRRERNLYLFFAKIVREYDNWLLIYDNVRQFHDIEKYYPYDTSVWGNGKIIITTRNSRIKDNILIPDSNMIKVDELTELEKTALFKKILPNNINESLKNELANQEFLKTIPSFPLDVITAAYYIREEKTPFAEYLKYIETHNNQFTKLQKELLLNIGGYDKSRYGIISTSVKHLIENNDLLPQLLLLCLLDSRNIPYNLVTKSKDPYIIDQISNIQKLALISLEDKTNNFISIHRSTQAIMLSVILDIVDAERVKKVTNQVVLDFVKYLDNKLSSFSTAEIKLMINHMQRMLGRLEISSDKSRILLKQALGEYHLRIDQDKQAKELFRQVVSDNKKHRDQNSTETATSLVLFAITLVDFAENDKAQELITTALNIFEKNKEDDNNIAWAKVWLGVIQRNNGDYKKSIDLLEQAVSIYDKNKKEQSLYWAYVYLGSSYVSIGNNEKAKYLLEKAQDFFIENNGPKHFRIAWLSTYLGKVYTNMKEYKKAEDALNTSLTLHKNLFEDKHYKIAWSMENLAALYTELGKYQKAKSLATRAIAIYNADESSNLLALSRTKALLNKINQALGE